MKRLCGHEDRPETFTVPTDEGENRSGADVRANCLITRSSHTLSAPLLMCPGKQWRCHEYLGSCTHVGNRDEALVSWLLPGSARALHHVRSEPTDEGFLSLCFFSSSLYLCLSNQ